VVLVGIEEEGQETGVLDLLPDEADSFEEVEAVEQML
jgi:hypothetical protein